MEAFRSLMVFFGFAPATVDFISELPVELAQHILRQLDAESLVRAALTSRQWMSICKGDPLLRKRVRRQLRKERRVAFGDDLPCRPTKSERVRYGIDEHVRSIPEFKVSYDTANIIGKGAKENFSRTKFKRTTMTRKRTLRI